MVVVVVISWWLFLLASVVVVVVGTLRGDLLVNVAMVMVVVVDVW